MSDKIRFDEAIGGNVSSFNDLDEIGVMQSGVYKNGTPLQLAEYVETVLAITIQKAFDNGQSIAIANGDNRTLTVTNSDVTNNPGTVIITNEAASSSLKITQTGDTGADKTADGALFINNSENSGIGLGVYSTNPGSNPLVTFVSDSSSFSGPVLYVEGNGTGGGEPTPIATVHFKYTGSHFPDGPLLFLDVQNTEGNTQALWIETPVTYGTVPSTGYSAIFMDTRHEGQGIFVDHKSPGRATYSLQTLTNRQTVTGDINMDVKRIMLVDDGATYKAGGTVLRLTAKVTETLGTISPDTTGVLDALQEHTTGTGTVLKSQNYGLGYALWLRHYNTAAVNEALRISNDATAAESIFISSDATTGSSYYRSGGIVVEARSLTTGNALVVYTDSSVAVGNSSFNGLAHIEAADSGSSVKLLYLKQAGTDASIYVEMLNDTPTDSGAIIVSNTGNENSAIYAYSNHATSTSANGLVHSYNDNVGSAQPLYVGRQDGTGSAISLDINGNAPAVVIDSEATTTDMISVDTVLTYVGNGIYIGDDISSNYSSIGRGRANTIATNYFYRNYSSANTEAPVVKICQDNSGDDQAALTILQEGTGAGIDMSLLAVDKNTFKFVGDAITAVGTVSHQIAVDIGGTTYYLVAYTHGT